MKQRLFDTPEDALDFAREITQNDEYDIDLFRTEDNQYRVSWIMKKEYTTYEGISLPDEVWIKDDGTMVHIQDLEVEHLQYIVRSYIRMDRAAVVALQESIDDAEDGFEDGFASMLTPPTLH